MAPSFISQLITSKAVPGEKAPPTHGGPTANTAAAGTPTQPTFTGNSRTNYRGAGGGASPGLPSGFTGIGGSPASMGIGGGIGGGATARLPMRSNLGLPMSLQMPLNFANVNTNNGNGNSGRANNNLPPSMMPMIPNMKRSVSKEYNSSNQAESESTSSSSSVSPTASSSSSSSVAIASTDANGKQTWNDAEKMQDFFLHIKDPEQFAQAENKLISIKDLVAKNASPIERFEAQQQSQEISSSNNQPQQIVSASATKASASEGNNALLSEMLASRNPGSATPSKSSERSNQDDNDSRRPQQQKQEARGDSRSNLLAEMLAKRGGGGQEETKPMEKSRAEQTGDSRGNMLAEMLARRGGGEAQAAAVQKPKQSSGGGDSRSNMLGELLAKRGGGSAPPQEESPVKKGGKRQALADMLSKRVHSSPQSKGSDSSPKSSKTSSNPLAAMLKRRLPPKSDTSEEGNPQEPQKESAQEDLTPLKDRPEYAAYFKMLKIGHPLPVVKHKIQRDGLDPAILDMDPNKPLPVMQAAAEESEDAETEAEFQARLAEYNEKSGKYTQMLKVGLPRSVVEHKMRMEGVDAAWLDGPPTKKKKPKSAAPAPPTEAEIAAHRAKYEKYFAMLKVGLPRGAVEHKMQMAGIDPKELDGPHPVAPPAGAASAPLVSPAIKNLKRSNSIRKKLHWEVKRQTSQSSSRESLWNLTIEDDAMEEIHISRESKEMLEKLFVKTISDTKKKPVAKKDADAAGGDDKKKPMIVLIDMKKSQNIAITLARVKMPFPELKREILAMNPTVLSTAQLQSLMDMWPDRKEQEAIDNFHGDHALLGTVRFSVSVKAAVVFANEWLLLVMCRLRSFWWRPETFRGSRRNWRASCSSRSSQVVFTSFGTYTCVVRRASAVLLMMCLFLYECFSPL